MAYIDWKIKVKRIVTCNCDYGCPCEFNAPPTHGMCEGLEIFEITKGHFGDTNLDGIRFAGIYRWPGKVHEGNGHYQFIIDDTATDAQREALYKIAGGEEQDATTIFNIYGATIETEHDPIFAPIAFEWDLDAATGQASVDGVFEATVTPIRNPVTGAIHRAAIKLPGGFEFREAEMASADFSSTGPISQRHTNSYGFLTYATYGPHGVVEAESYPNGSI